MAQQGRLYYKGAPIRKSLVRGYLHLAALLLSPVWFLYFWHLFPIKSCETTSRWIFLDLFVLSPKWLWCIVQISIVCMLLTSTWYHLVCHKNSQQCEIARRLDMIMVNFAITLNFMPQLMFCGMHLEIVLYLLLWMYLVLGITFLNPRNTMVIGSGIQLLFSLFHSAPELGRCFANQIVAQPHVYYLPVVTVTILGCGIIVLYIFSDNDIPPKGRKELVIGTHDMIHFLSLVVIVNLCYYNGSILSLGS